MMNRREMLGSAGAISLLPALPVAGPDAGAAVPDIEALLQLGPVQRGAGNHRWAQILQGSVTGQMLGIVRSGRLDWHVDPASGAVEAHMQCRVQCADGKLRELRKRSWHVSSAGQGKVRLSVPVAS